MNHFQIEQYWQRYLQTLLPGVKTDCSYLTDQFGDTPELAKELGQLVLAGTKTG
ncbi:hypothetical protein IQ241_02900 [Romeria aff. gracilis LEGE 07310]|uniref:Uncharacterized protein n=1 Tax=Vasconcelosia minhoensis LEGE 07310 TaxID=915328 RepID=A0A8J7AKA6_9CYAN|nr:hypothetical protein [Romeria gracilis]MBE9076254.1 hypothetical protein [Romeria aff. gracilis LEGE 07310]